MARQKQCESPDTSVEIKLITCNLIVITVNGKVSCVILVLEQPIFSVPPTSSTSKAIFMAYSTIEYLVTLLCYSTAEMFDVISILQPICR